MKWILQFIIPGLFPLQLLAQYGSAADSLYHIQDSVLIPTRDGHFISATIVHKKNTAGALPVILFYTPYSQGREDLFFGKSAADKAYVGVVAYSRGIRTQRDDFFPYIHDGNDVYDVIEWISKQPWCNGQVGMHGGSYVGFVQWAAVKKIHPALKTIVPQVAIMPGFDFPMENNIPHSNALVWANELLQYKPLPADFPFLWYEKGSSYRSLDSLAGQPNRIFQQWLQHPNYDHYWKSLIPTPRQFANIQIPVLTTSGYYDGAQSGHMQYVWQYFRYNKNPRLYLVMGPYDHFGAQRNPAPLLYGYSIDSAAILSFHELVFAWFDYIFKRKDKPAILKDKINVEVMGANEWKHVSSPEKINSGTLRFFLSNARADQSGFLLTKQKPAKAAFLQQVVDFTDRSTQNNYFTPFIINDSIDKSNGLMFVSDPFPESLILNGQFHGQLSVLINKKDLDFSLAFYEWMPDGKYFNLGSYVGRASYARNNSRRQLLQPGIKTTIPFGKTHWVIKKIQKGSRLVIVLNINKHPYEEINYGSGKNVHDETIRDAGASLLVKWFTDSYINVPVWK